MSESGIDHSEAAETDDALLAEWVAQVVDRIEAGESVDLDNLAGADPKQVEQFRQMLPTIRQLKSFGRAVAASAGSLGAAASLHERTELGMLGDFRLIREVGRGGMGVVYEAEQISLGRRVALKILSLAGALDPRHHQRFLLEARAAACLHHANIVPVHAVGSERGVPYYAMLFIDGYTLAELLERLPERDPASTLVPSPATPCSLGTSSYDQSYIRTVAEHGRRAAEALDHAHGRGIIHRDIKPANLMLDAEGHLWITDFGLAQIQGDFRMTMTGDVVGTLRYMSPEQALAKRVVIDGRTDLYSLGATLYELLGRQPVFDGVDRAEILRKIAQEEPIPLRKLNPSVPRDLETIIHKTLGKEPSERYATAHELAKDLGRFLDARPISARPPGPRERVGKWARRNRAIVGPTVVFAVLAMVALAGGLIWSNNWLSRHNERLRIERDRAEQFSVELKNQRDLAEQRRSLADRHLYAFRIRQAAEALRARQLEMAQDILLDCRPGPGQDDFREFAWQRLWRESRREVGVLSERTERVASLAVSLDGRLAATGDDDGTLRVRDAETGALLNSYRRNGIVISGLAFSPDGLQLASGTGYGPDPSTQLKSELIVRDIATGQPLLRFDGVEGRSIYNLLYHPSGKYLWEKSSRPMHPDRVVLWQLDGGAGGKLPTLLRRWPKPSDCISIAKLELRLAQCNATGRFVTVEEGATGRVVRRIERRHNRIHHAGLSLDGRFIATAEWVEASKSRAVISVWDVDSGQLLHADLKVPWWPHVVDLQFSPDKRHLVALGVHGEVCVYDLVAGKTWTVDPVREESESTVGKISLLPGGRLLSIYHDSSKAAHRSLRIYDIETRTVRATFPERLDGLFYLNGRPDGRSLVFISSLRAVVWHFDPEPIPPQPGGHTDEAWAVAFRNDGLFATGSDDTDDPSTFKLWDGATGRLVRAGKPHDATTSAIAFSPDGAIYATAGLKASNNLRLWDSANGQLLATLDGHTDKVRALTFSPNGTLLASAGDDFVIRVWDVAARREVLKLSDHKDKVRQLSFSPDGQTLASVSNDTTVRLWSTSNGKPLWTHQGAGKLADVAFSPDGRLLFWAQEDGIIQRWDLTRGLLLASLHSEYEELRCLAFSPDGRTLAAAGKSGNVHLWEPVSGQELMILEGRPCQVNALAFSPDGSALAAVWHDGTVRYFRSR